MKKVLFATYPKVLVEASPFDRIWGIGLEEHDKYAADETKWKGLNMLGFILTDVRDELMADASKIEKGTKTVFLATYFRTSTVD